MSFNVLKNARNTIPGSISNCQSDGISEADEDESVASDETPDFYDDVDDDYSRTSASCDDDVSLSLSQYLKPEVDDAREW